ncbi:MAG TPA: anhydro-N-acetylmuramic acid kinase [Thermomicrobiales bacterium]|nr:anhydro-N-acetylmuramic acid kinase [Thermomicrobiales bacterium]
MTDICVGLISGTSLDGIDVAVCGIDGHAQEAKIELLMFDTIAWPDAVRAELLKLYDDQTDAVARVCALNVVIGERFADAAAEVLERAGIDGSQIEVIGSHGQTIWHQPEADPEDGLIVPSTLQIGEASVIAARIGAPVIADFRVADMAVGGQGAPLAPYLDWAIFSDPMLGRAVQNIGGIGNVTWLPAGGAVDDVVAFDTGPGNMLIDALVTRLTQGKQTFDANGAIGANGEVDYDLLTKLMADPYLAEKPPKTTGREYYGTAMVEEILRDRVLNADVIATATAFTAHSIADAYQRWLPRMPDEVYVNGGGARNPLLMRMLADALDGIPVRATDELGIDADAKEAVAFALMAHDSLAGLPTNIPGATGAGRAVSLGKLTRL